VRLTASLITRDEQHNLGACLDSIGSVVDEIVVVDTGSTDDTINIARSFGALVAECPWQADFSLPRNHGLDLASGDWILYIDADERFSVDGDLRDALNDPDLVAGLVRFRSASGFNPYLEHRLFRNRVDIRFRSAMHETIVPDVRRIVAAEGKRVDRVPASIEHLGYEGDQRAKHLRNLPMLEAAVRADPRRTYLWLDLGRVYNGLGDPTNAEKAWVRGVREARERGAAESPDLLIHVELALHRIEDGRTAADLLSALTAASPDDPLTWWVTARQAMFEHRWRDAITWLESLHAIDPDELEHPGLGYSRAVFGEHAEHALGICWFKLGDWQTAAGWFALAELGDPGNLEYHAKRLLSEARAATR
jgi:tetratricopeptide (TPR) repeat protein